MNENRYIVYKHIFPNGKSYIGITKQDPLKRWQKGEGYKTQPKIYNAIKKYNWENVTHIIIAKNLYEDEAKKFDEDMWNQTFSNHKKWWFNPHKRALKLFYEKVTKNNLFKSEVE